MADIVAFGHLRLGRMLVRTAHRARLTDAQVLRQARRLRGDEPSHQLLVAGLGTLIGGLSLAQRCHRGVERSALENPLRSAVERNSERGQLSGDRFELGGGGTQTRFAVLGRLHVETQRRLRLHRLVACGISLIGGDHRVLRRLPSLSLRSNLVRCGLHSACHGGGLGNWHRPTERVEVDGNLAIDLGNRSRRLRCCCGSLLNLRCGNDDGASTNAALNRTGKRLDLCTPLLERLQMRRRGSRFVEHLCLRLRRRLPAIRLGGLLAQRCQGCLVFGASGGQIGEGDAKLGLRQHRHFLSVGGRIKPQVVRLDVGAVGVGAVVRHLRGDGLDLSVEILHALLEQCGGVLVDLATEQLAKQGLPVVVGSDEKVGELALR